MNSINACHRLPPIIHTIPNTLWWILKSATLHMNNVSPNLPHVFIEWLVCYHAESTRTHMNLVEQYMNENWNITRFPKEVGDPAHLAEALQHLSDHLLRHESLQVPNIWDKRAHYRNVQNYECGEALNALLLAKPAITWDVPAHVWRLSRRDVFLNGWHYILG